MIAVITVPILSSSQSEGKVKLNRYTIDLENSDRSLLVSQTIWYKNEQSIQEIPHLNINTDSLGTHTEINIKYYLFIDASLWLCYYFKDFSSKAKIVKSNKGNCQIQKLGGWDMNGVVPGFETENLARMSDTFLLGYKYERYLFEKQNNGNTNHYILYAQKNKFEIPIKLFKYFSDKIESSVVRMDTYYNNQLVGITHIEYLSDTLTTDETYLFQRWSKRLKLDKCK